MANRSTLFAACEAEPPAIKGSRFPAFAISVSTEEACLAFVDEVRRLHPGARHCAWAYLLDDGGYRSSDDGEPGGSAGRPILARIEGAELVDVCVAVVRYSSGIKLGVGGLIRAYGGSAAAVLAGAERRTIVDQVEVRIRCSFSDQALVERSFAGAVVLERSFGAEVCIRAQIPADGFEKWRAELNTKSAGRIQVETT